MEVLAEVETAGLSMLHQVMALLALLIQVEAEEELPIMYLLLVHLEQVDQEWY